MREMLFYDDDDIYVFGQLHVEETRTQPSAVVSTVAEPV